MFELLNLDTEARVTGTISVAIDIDRDVHLALASSALPHPVVGCKCN